MGTKLPEFQLPDGYSVWSGGGDWWFECLARGARVRSVMFNNREAAAVQAWKHHATGLRDLLREALPYINDDLSDPVSLPSRIVGVLDPLP